MLDALSFESTGHESTPGQDDAEKNSTDSTAVTPHELVLMELGDEDEIEIELEEEDDETTQTGDDSAVSGNLPLFPVYSDDAVAAFSGSGSVTDEEATSTVASTAEDPKEKEEVDLQQDRSIRSRRKWWKRRQGKSQF